MFKVLKPAVLITLSANLLCYSTIPITANEQPIDYQGIFEEANDFTETFKSIGVDSGTLLEILALNPKDNTTVYSNNNDLETYFLSLDRKKYNPADYDLGIKDRMETTSVLDGDNLDGNPPYSAKEQADRMAYIESVFQRDYYQDRYQPIHGNYLAYLYANHYTDNINYDRTATKPNFDEMYANIVSADDIIEYDIFYQTMQNGAVISSFRKGADIIDDIHSAITSEITSSEEIIENIKVEKNKMKSHIDNLKKLSEALDDGQQIINDLPIAFLDNYNKAEDATALIELVNNQLSETHGLSGTMNSLSDEYVSMMIGMISNPIITGIAGPIIACTGFYFEVLIKLMPVLTITKLLLSHNARWGHRAFIYYGAEQRP